MQDRKKSVLIDVQGPTRETEKAGLYGTTAGDVWIPKSQIRSHVTHNGVLTKLEVPLWLAIEKGIVEDPNA